MRANGSSPRGRKPPTAASPALPPCNDVGLLIGPEGGISAREIAESGARTVTLGARILRTETAALAATAIVMAIMGEI